MSVSIKVAIRCRPFTIDDDLGVTLTQRGEEEGEASKFATDSKIHATIFLRVGTFPFCGYDTTVLV